MLELPGLEPKDISVKLSDETVVISGKKGNPPIGEEKGGYFLHERRYGKFERSFRMPSDGNPGGIEASLNQGVLTVRIPKYADTARPEREIEVRPS